MAEIYIVVYIVVYVVVVVVVVVVVTAVVRWLLYGLLLANVPMALYFSLVHQRGSIAVMDHLRNVS